MEFVAGALVTKSVYNLTIGTMASAEKDNRPPIGFNLNDFNSTTQLTEKGKAIQEDEYNPFDHREVEKPNSTSGSLAHLLKSSLGTGILAMPMAFKNAGLLVGSVGTILVGLLCMHAVHILVKTSHEVCKKTRIPSLGFAETAGKVFESAGPRMRKYANFAKNFCDYGLVATYLGANCVYIVFIASTFHAVFNKMFGLDYDVRLYIAMVTVALVPISQIRQLKYLVPFSAMANAFVVVTFSITLYYLFSGEMKFEERPMFSSWAQLPQFFSTVIFAMEGIGVVMPVENAMKKPQHFLGCPGVLSTAMITVITLYSVIGFFGYVRFGPAVEGSITMNLPVDALSGQIAQILIGWAIFFTFALQLYVPMDILWRKMETRVRKENHNLCQIIFRTGVVLTLGGIAAAVPKLEPFIGLVGAVFFSILGLLVPAVVETVFRWPNDLGFGNWMLYKNIFLGVFSILALVTGSTVSIKEIIHMYIGGGDHKA